MDLYDWRAGSETEPVHDVLLHWQAFREIRNNLPSNRRARSSGWIRCI